MIHSIMCRPVARLSAGPRSRVTSPCMQVWGIRTVIPIASNELAHLLVKFSSGDRVVDRHGRVCGPATSPGFGRGTRQAPGLSALSPTPRPPQRSARTTGFQGSFPRLDAPSDPDVPTAPIRSTVQPDLP
jgi:hypothetical protein